MTSPEVVSPEVIGNDFIGRAVSVREIMFAPFYSPGFCRVFSSETPWGLLRNF